jgi:Acetyltransferase (GNAT) domain
MPSLKPVCEPVALDLILEELNDAYIYKRQARHTSSRTIYVTDIHQSPNVVREVGRLREISFRALGGGTGEELDLDEYDTCEAPYQQMIVWDNEDNAIVGGYRFLESSKIKHSEAHGWESPMAHLFEYKPAFVEKYMPHGLELGRSFIQPFYQSGASRKGMYSLANLWDGLGAILSRSTWVHYFFGKVTMYPSFNQKARDLILFFIGKHFKDTESLMAPHNPLILTTPSEELEQIFNGETYREDYKILSKLIKSYGEHIPPLVNSYMNLSGSMKTFGTAVNESFGMVEETGILITIADIYEDKRQLVGW